MERQGNPHQETPEHLDPTEAIAFELTEPTTEIWFHFDGDVGGSQWSLYDAAGERIALANNARYFAVADQLDPDTGIGHFYLTGADGEAVTFKYIAFDGGADAQFSLRPLTAAELESGEILAGAQTPEADGLAALVADTDEPEVPIDLSDLLDGASSNDIAGLTQYVHVGEDDDSGGLLLSLNHQGLGLDAGIDQVIAVESLTLSDLGLDAGMDQTELLDSLLAKGIVTVD